MASARETVALKLEDLLQDLDPAQQQQAMAEVVAILEEENLLAYSPQQSSPWAFARTVILDNQDLRIGPLQAANAEDAEDPADLIRRLLIQ